MDVSTAECNLCRRHIKISGDTTNMMKHLNPHEKEKHHRESTAQVQGIEIVYEEEEVH